MLIVVGLTLVVLAAAGFWLTSQRDKRLESEGEALHPWAELAQRLELRFEDRLRVSGLWGGVYVEITRVREDLGQQPITRILVNAPSPVTIDLRQRDWESKPDVRGCYTLDHRFDAFFEIVADEVEAVALLNFETRNLLVDTFLRGEVQVRDGVIHWTQSAIGSPDQLQAIVRRLAKVALCLYWGDRSVQERLMRNADGDRTHAIRLRNLRVLFTAFPTSEQAQRIARTISPDYDPEARLAAATFLGDEAALTKLAESNLVPRRFRVSARRHLATLEARRDKYWKELGTVPGGASPT